MPIRFFDYFITEDTVSQNVIERYLEQKIHVDTDTTLTAEQKKRLKSLANELIKPYKIGYNKTLNFLQNTLTKQQTNEFERRLQIIEDAIQVEKGEMRLDQFESKHLERRKYNRAVTIAIIAFLGVLAISVLAPSAGCIFGSFIVILSLTSHSKSIRPFHPFSCAYNFFTKHNAIKKYVTSQIPTPRPFLT